MKKNLELLELAQTIRFIAFLNEAGLSYGYMWQKIALHIPTNFLAKNWNLNSINDHDELANELIKFFKTHPNDDYKHVGSLLQISFTIGIGIAEDLKALADRFDQRAMPEIKHLEQFKNIDTAYLEEFCRVLNFLIVGAKSGFNLDQSVALAVDTYGSERPQTLLHDLQLTGCKNLDKLSNRYPDYFFTNFRDGVVLLRETGGNFVEYFTSLVKLAEQIIATKNPVQ